MLRLRPIVTDDAFHGGDPIPAAWPRYNRIPSVAGSNLLTPRARAAGVAAPYSAPAVAAPEIKSAED